MNPQTSSARISHDEWKFDGALTIDLEDWRCALDPKPNADHRSRPAVDAGYVRDATIQMLFKLEDYGAKATFFVLGEVAKAVPEVVREIARKGHEIASHSPVHLPPKMIPRAEFATLLRRDLNLLHDLSGKKPIGFRAPYFSINRSDGWLLELLAESGLSYDSSVVPTWTPYWGIPSAPKSPYFPDFSDLSKRKGAGNILEIPVTVWPSWERLMGLPVGGGFYMRVWPTSVLMEIMRRNVRSEHRLVIYIHPGNLQQDKERVPSPSVRDRLSQYALAGRGMSTFTRLLEEFRFGSVSEVFSHELSEVRRS
jgi:polysaccharide deacetylase family protein (PEP-CTERM system associated)